MTDYMELAPVGIVGCVESPGLTESVSGSSSIDSSGRERRKRKRREEEWKQQERWIANLESSNSALSNSLELLTKSAKHNEERERLMGVELTALRVKISEYEQKIAKLEKSLLDHRAEAETTRRQFGLEDPSELARENTELKENLKALAQLLLSNPLDARTTKLLHVLTAPVGGLGAVGSRSGVLGLERFKGGDESVTPLALMGAAVQGPVPDTQSTSGSSLSELLQSQSGGKPRTSGFKIDFGFTFNKKKKTPTLFGLLLGVCITSMLPVETPLPLPHPTPNHAARKLLSHPQPSTLTHTFVTTVVVISTILLSIAFANFVASRFFPQNDDCLEPLLPSHYEPDKKEKGCSS